MSEAVNIAAPVLEICRLLELEPNRVRRLDITPRAAIVEVYTVNAEGHKHVDSISNEPAFVSLSFDIVTCEGAQT